MAGVYFCVQHWGLLRGKVLAMTNPKTFSEEAKILELFSGSKSFANVASSLGLQTFTSDIERDYEPDYCVDILDFDTSVLPFKPDIIWASPPCTSFSVASIGKHWHRDHTPKTAEAEHGLAIVQRTLDIIKELKPKLWYIENPRGKLRKLIPQMLDATLGNFWVQHTVTYCQYGDSRMKPTDIWTNDFNWRPRPVCRNGGGCHTPAPRGSRTGTQGLVGSYERSKVPNQLCLEILKP